MPDSFLKISGKDPEPVPNNGFEKIFFRALCQISILVNSVCSGEIQL